MRRTSVAVLGGYFVLSVLLLGARVLPHPGRDFVGGLTTDPQIFVWSFAWWPHAILHGENPLVTHDVWAPVGVNLAWTASSPALAIAFAPLTLAFNSTVAYNVAALLMPALSAWTAYLLCRHLTNSTWPSLVGGYLFGFSTYELGATLAHIHTSAVFLIPLAALWILRFLEGTLGSRQLVVRLGILLAVQLLISTEIFFTLTLAFIVGLILLALLVPRTRPRLPTLTGTLALAYGVAGVLTIPFLYYLLTAGTGAGPAAGNDTFVGDAVNFVVPTHIEAIGWWASHLARHFPANDLERGTYLGLPTLLILALFGVRRWRSPSARFLLTAFALAGIATLGSWLTFDGHRLFALPWRLVASHPVFSDVMPSRFSMYMTLAAAVIVALWAGSRLSGRRTRIVLPILAVVAIVPNIALAGWAGPHTKSLFSPYPPTVPALFTTDRYKSCIRQGETVLALPFGARSNSLIWQADTGFWFKLAGGYIAPRVPSLFLQVPGSLLFASNLAPRTLTPDEVRTFAELSGASVIVLNEEQNGPTSDVLDHLGHAILVQGARMYRLHGTWPDLAACDAGT